VAARVLQVLNQAAISELLDSPRGPVARDLYRRAVRVQNTAKRNLQRYPRRVDTGTLRSNIHIEMVMLGGHPAMRVGCTLYYAIFVHNGTGIYGPRHRRITPLRARYLRFRPRTSQQWVYARSVAGMRPNPFLADALPAARY
jgi:hypothetical protein